MHNDESLYEMIDEQLLFETDRTGQQIGDFLEIGEQVSLCSLDWQEEDQEWHKF
jgi:hypothetical protein